MQEAYKCKDCEFIWLLDDDNKPLDGSLKVLIYYWNNLELENKEEKLALLSYRFKKEQHAKRAITEDKPELVIGPKNSFFGFHIKYLPIKIFKYIRRNLSEKEHSITLEKENRRYGVVPVAPYGGLFICKKILDLIGYPNEEFYLYGDDHEWSYRITKNGGKIYLILDSKIDDLELSWHIPQNKKQTSFSIISEANPFRVYYSVRNRVFFEVRNLVDNKLIYWINVGVYVLLIALVSRKNLKLIVRAIKDGYYGKLGIRIKPEEWIERFK